MPTGGQVLWYTWRAGCKLMQDGDELMDGQVCFDGDPSKCSAIGAEMVIQALRGRKDYCITPSLRASVPSFSGDSNILLAHY